MIRRIISTAVTASAVSGLVGLYVTASRWRDLHLAACRRIVELERLLRRERQAFDAVAGIAGDAWTSNIRLHQRVHELEADLAALRAGGAPEHQAGETDVDGVEDAHGFAALAGRILRLEGIVLHHVHVRELDELRGTLDMMISEARERWKRLDQHAERIVKLEESVPRAEADHG